jgi:EAL domain-containing protein (putative c-di-GMP-specific phosphodiesterase class I)
MNKATDSKPLHSLMATAMAGVPGNDGIKRSLHAIRAYLGMDIAYVSEFVGDRVVFRQVDAPGLEAVIKVGDSHSIDDVYCGHILEGRLPQLMPNTANEPVAMAMAMAITKQASIGKHISVPIRLADGKVHGMFCCLGFKADDSLGQRDLQMMRVFADLAAFEIDNDLKAATAVKEKQDRIRGVIDSRQISIVYQPIWKLGQARPVGFECLARFTAAPQRTPDKWFAEAGETGLSTELELTAIRLALGVAKALPSDIYLAVNASPQTFLSEELADALGGIPPQQIVLEITEHANIDNYDDLRAALRPLRERGVRLAVDDAGAGYCTLRHILQLQPDLIKLDMSLTRNINLDPARRALASALVLFARDTGSCIIAEGVETASELSILQSIGIQKAQGFFLGRPLSFDEAVKLCVKEPPKIDRVA